MNTGDGHLEVIALAINTIGDHLYYSADPSFIHNYGGILLLDNIIKWNLKKHFVAWMKSIIYHSFLRHSFEGRSTIPIQSCLKIQLILLCLNYRKFSFLQGFKIVSL
ncbi:hypothetical protein RHMOL_Rhmol01G0241700 [Rhododendron molle]|uniref:Uncharacterized protein n=1 Tax=Rhododendron molle TaxID=49168 RepID=A0ACC0Q4P5_RHOML|nr:hypothetical protein RHMOL_Rhmol01G0241700 [Rhododendron molle]